MKSHNFLFKPIDDMELEKRFLKILSIKYNIPFPLLVSINLYSICGGQNDFLYFCLNQLAGLTIKFPTMDEMKDILFNLKIYDEVKKEQEKGTDLDEILSIMSVNFESTPIDLFSAYQMIKTYEEGNSDK